MPKKVNRVPARQKADKPSEFSLTTRINVTLSEQTADAFAIYKMELSQVAITMPSDSAIAAALIAKALRTEAK